MSYFAKPNFIVYDEWFDHDLEKNNLYFKNKKIKKNSYIHEFFFEQSNYKVGASENNLQFDLKLNKKELTTNNYHEDLQEKFTSISNKKFQLFEKIAKNKLKFQITKRLIYSLSIFGFIFTFVFIMFFVSQSKKNESNITNQSLVLEKKL